MTVDIVEAKRLRTEEGLTLRQVAEHFGVSKSYISWLLRRKGLSGYRDYPALRDPATFEKPDDVIAKELNVTRNRVSTARRALKIRRRRSVSLAGRRERFVHGVFGRAWKPGPNFPAITGFIRDSLVNSMADRVLEFYVEGRAGLTGYSRFLRSKAANHLRECIIKNGEAEKLAEDGILERAD